MEDEELYYEIRSKLLDYLKDFDIIPIESSVVLLTRIALDYFILSNLKEDKQYRMYNLFRDTHTNYMFVNIDKDKKFKEPCYKIIILEALKLSKEKSKEIKYYGTRFNIDENVELVDPLTKEEEK